MRRAARPRRRRGVRRVAAGGGAPVKALAALLAGLLLCLPGTAEALRANKALHHYVRGDWSIEDGLPQVSATSLVQDGDGYVWIGTQSGLARFDGVRFTTFTPEKEPGMPGVWVRSLHLGRDGRVWVGTYKGVTVYDGRRFTPVPAADPARWPALEIAALAEDTAGTVWAGGPAGLFRADAGRLHPVAGAPTPSSALLLRRDGAWVGTRGAVHRYRDGRWQVLPLPAEAGAAGVHRLVEAQGRLWAATSLGLFVLEDGAWTQAQGVPQLAGVPVELLYADRTGELWAGGDVGLARIRERRAVDFVAPDDPGGIPGVRAALQDREGSLWFGSLINGLTRLRDSWTRRYSLPEGLNERIVWSLAPDPDGRRTWVGGMDGVSVFDGARFRSVADGAALPHPQAYNLLAERERLWIGTRRGLAVIDHTGPQAGTLQRPALLAPLAGAQINGVVRSPDGDLWIPTTEGLYRLRGETLRRFGQKDGLADVRVRYFFRTPRGQVLAGTQSGLFELRGERFVASGLDRGLPPGLDVTAITALDDGRLVLGSLSEHTYFFERGRWHTLRAADGLPANAAFHLAQHRGFLWVGGLRGISRVPVEDLSAFAAGQRAQVRGEMLLNERGDTRSGQQGYCCNGAGNAKGFLRGDSLWFPSRDGIVAMDTDLVARNAVPPTVRIERMHAGEDWRQAHQAQHARLPAEARDLSFEFTVLSFQDPKSVGIDYRLRGYDQQWRSANALQRSARYTNLPPGPYTFEVRGSNNAGVPALRTATLPFSILPRFHETRWFRGLLVLLGGGLLLAGYRLLQRRHRHQRQALEALVRQRTEDLEIANRQLQEASDTDPLTGLRNRRYLTSRISADLAHHDRRAGEGEHAGQVMAFALIDIDHFKRINDSYGHVTGDRVLVQFAQLLRQCLRSDDYLVRWGGEEFLIVYRPMPGEQVLHAAAQLCERVAAHRFEHEPGKPLAVTCSVGVAEYPLATRHEAPVKWESMVELADRALYHVKDHGRNGWAAFRPVDRLDIGILLRQLRHDPHALFSGASGRVVGSVGALQRPF